MKARCLNSVELGGVPDNRSSSSREESCTVPALMINLRIDAKEKFDFFKVTLSDLSGLFEECHIKIRGRYASECVKYAQDHLGNGIHTYQDLQEKDWVAATLEMVSCVQSRSVFLYIEDHRLLASRQRLEQTLACFDRLNLDYLSYSFFRASKLDVANLLPLGPIQHDLLSEFQLTRSNLDLIRKLSPGFYTFSLVSVVSVEYFRSILAAENKNIKIFSRIINGVLARWIPLRRRRVVHKINAVLSRFGAILCLYDPSSAFNLEKMWYEAIPNDKGWKYGIATDELFANYDDDNGAYAESLIKRGLYPFKAHEFDHDITDRYTGVACRLSLNDGERYDCTYYSHNARIRRAPIVQIDVTRGSIAVLYQGDLISLSPGETRFFYSNLGPVIQCRERAEVELRVFDEAFQ